MATWEFYSTSKTENPDMVIPVYIEGIQKSIAELENDILVTQKQLLAARTALKALEALNG